MPRYIPLVYDPSRDLLITKTFWIFFSVSLWALYALLCLWFVTGCKVAWGVVKGEQAEDTRSEGEE